MAQDTKEFLFYIDATESHVGNWMKYIGCARFFEEQNIVSQQEGTEIYYKAIKVGFTFEKITIICINYIILF